VVAFLERVARYCPRRVRHRRRCLSGRQQPERRLPQPRLGRGREAVALHDQPRLERGAARDVEAFEQLTVQVEQAPGVGQLTGEGVDVDRDAVTEARCDRITPEQPWRR
jgi:hypothetical protein